METWEIWENGQLRNIGWRSAFRDVKRVHGKRKTRVKERQVTAINDPLLLISYYYGNSYCLAATTNCCRLIDKVLRLGYRNPCNTAIVVHFRSFYFTLARRGKKRMTSRFVIGILLWVVPRNAELKSAIGERVDETRPR